jgi:hypothetical protein
MGFDQNDPSPIIQPKKRTTKVNLFVATAVFIFLSLSVAGIVYFAMRSDETDSAEVAPERS